MPEEREHTYSEDITRIVGKDREKLYYVIDKKTISESDPYEEKEWE